MGRRPGGDGPPIFRALSSSARACVNRYAAPASAAFTDSSTPSSSKSAAGGFALFLLEPAQEGRVDGVGPYTLALHRGGPDGGTPTRT